MTQNKTTRYAPGYDLFKLVVAIILALIFFLLLRNARQGVSSGVAVTFTAADKSALATPTLPPISTRTSSLPTTTTTPTATAASTSTLPPPPTATPTPEQESTSTPEPATSTPEAQTSVSEPGCPSGSSRIKVGDSVQVLSRLNFRAGPGLQWTILLTNPPGAKLQVLDGPVCTRGGSAQERLSYVWWKVRMENGREGWSAESPLWEPYYFLEPVR